MADVESYLRKNPPEVFYEHEGRTPPSEADVSTHTDEAELTHADIDAAYLELSGKWGIPSPTLRMAALEAAGLDGSATFGSIAEEVSAVGRLVELGVDAAPLTFADPNEDSSDAASEIMRIAATNSDMRHENGQPWIDLTKAGSAVDKVVARAPRPEPEPPTATQLAHIDRLKDVLGKLGQKATHADVVALTAISGKASDDDLASEMEILRLAQTHKADREDEVESKPGENVDVEAEVARYVAMVRREQHMIPDEPNRVIAAR
jgi:hypothetical protein